MNFTKRQLGVAVLAATLIGSGCTGSSGDAVAPPTGLQYMTNPATYAVGVAIPANPPAVSGGPTVSFAVLPALPAGLSLNTTTGVITGTPTAVTAKATYLVTATNSAGSATAGLVITVEQAVRPPYGLSYSANPAVYTVGKVIPSNTPSSSGGAVTSYSVTPALPAGLVLGSASGVITGTPTAATALAAYKITASNLAGSAVVEVTLTVNAAELPPSGLTYSASPVTYTVGNSIAPNTPSSTGGAVTSYGVSPALPNGLSFNTTTGVVSGLPTAAAAKTTYTVTASNGAGSTTAGLTITVDAAVTPPKALQYSLNPANYTVGVQITPNIPSSAGGAVTSYSLNSPLPTGLALSPSTGVVTGTPAVVVAPSSYSVTATNSAGSTSVTLSITVNGPPVQKPTNLLYTPSSVSYTVNTPVSPLQNPTYSGSPVTSWTPCATMPAGLSLNSAGAVTGTPTAATTTAVPCLITAANSAGNTTATLTITVSPTTVIPSQVAYPDGSYTFTVGTPASTPAPTASGSAVTSWAAPNLPAGLSINPNSGVISGTPTAQSNMTGYTVTATNSAGSAPGTVNIAVNASPTPPSSNGTFTIQTQSTPSGSLPSVAFAGTTVTIHSPLWVNFQPIPPVAIQSDDVTVTLTIAAVGSGAPVAQFYSYPVGNNTTPTLSTQTTCFIRVPSIAAGATAPLAAPVGCGLGLQPTGSAGSITVTGTVQTANPYSYSIAPIQLSFAAPTTVARTVTFTNNSSQTIWVGITGGAANSFLDPLTPTVAANTSPYNNKQQPVKGGGGQVCGFDSATPPYSPTAACPIGSTCVQGGAGPNPTPGVTTFYFRYDQGVPSPGYQLAAPTATAPGGTTTLTISGASFAPLFGGANMIWSGNFYGRTACGPNPPVVSDQSSRCLVADCSGASPSWACAIGTGATPATATLAEVTFQTTSPATDYYDVSIIGGANLAMQFGPTGEASTPLGYFCGTAGSTKTVPANPSNSASVAGATWTMNFGTTLPFPSTTNPPIPFPLPLPSIPAPTGDSSSYYLMVNPVLNSDQTVTQCTTHAKCAPNLCGFAQPQVIALGSAGLPLLDGSTRYCGTKLSWITANQLWAANQTASNNGPFAFNNSFPAIPPTSYPGGTTSTYYVSNLQQCINQTYTSYEVTPQDPRLACGGVIWGSQPPLPSPPNPSGNNPRNLTYQNFNVQNPGLYWLPYVLPTITWLKQACPSCYTFPFDDATSTFTCPDNGKPLNYSVTFSDLDPQ